MTLGFSLGDFIAVAQLAYQLSKALSESKGATEEYRTLIAELDVVHRVLLQVNDLRASNQLPQATVNALLFTVNSTRELIGSFLDSHSAYSSCLKPGGSGNPVKDMLVKGRWATQMPVKARATTKDSGLQGILRLIMV